MTAALDLLLTSHKPFPRTSRAVVIGHPVLLRTEMTSRYANCVFLNYLTLGGMPAIPGHDLYSYAFKFFAKDPRINIEEVYGKENELGGGPEAISDK